MKGLVLQPELLMTFVLITEEGLPAFAAAFWPWKVMSVRRGSSLGSAWA